jgi:hypothetical protein
VSSKILFNDKQSCEVYGYIINLLFLKIWSSESFECEMDIDINVVVLAQMQQRGTYSD